MQDSVRDPFDDSPPEGGGIGAVIARWAGGVLSLALLGGVAYWAYQIGQRDAMAVPVIQAMTGPAKELPEDPGGMKAEHQGLTVTSIMEGRAPKPRPEAIHTAPPPAELAEEDKPGVELPPRVADLPAAPATTPVADPPLAQTEPPGLSTAPSGEIIALARTPVEDTPVPRNEAEKAAAPPAPEDKPAADTAPPPLPAADIRNVSETEKASETEAVVARTDEVEPAPPLAPDEPPGRNTDPTPIAAPSDPVPPGPAETPAEIEVADLQPTATAPRRSDPPRVRPGATPPAPRRPTQDEPSSPATATETEPADPVRKAAATPPKGTVLIQLGAFDSPAVARSEWDRLVARHRDLLGTKGMLVQRTVSSGRVFYRLRAEGFDSLANAKDTCAALIARGAACITARQD